METREPNGRKQEAENGRRFVSCAHLRIFFTDRNPEHIQERERGAFHFEDRAQTKQATPLLRRWSTPSLRTQALDHGTLRGQG
ncbi:hypothetical protein FKM82_026306 [Ascaphus truei]